MFCAGRVVDEDLKRTMKACGGSIQTSVGNLSDDVLGTCEVFEEIQVGGERYEPSYLYPGSTNVFVMPLLLKEGELITAVPMFLLCPRC